MYICAQCFTDTDAMSARLMSIVGACEVCGELRGDWGNKFVSWTSELDRDVGQRGRLPVAQQIKRLRRRILEIEAHAGTIDPED